MTADTAQSSAPKQRRSLHTIVGDMLAVIDEAGGEVTAAVDELGLELEYKAQAFAAVTRQLAAEAKAFEELAHEYKQKAAARETQITALKFRMEQALTTVGVDKLKTPTATWYFQSSKAVSIADETAFLGGAEDRFVTVKQYVNKTAVREALDAGEVVEGAELRANRSLRVR
jgi:hypothetical protein